MSIETKQLFSAGYLKEKFESFSSKDASPDSYMVVFYNETPISATLTRESNNLATATITNEELQNSNYLVSQFALFADESGSRTIQAIYALNAESFEKASVDFAKLELAV